MVVNPDAIYSVANFTINIKARSLKLPQVAQKAHKLDLTWHDMTIGSNLRSRKGNVH